jgi:hypothetical protein
MLKGKWKGRTPFLKVRFEDFRTFTVQKTLAHYVTSGEELHQVMMAFLKEKWKGSPKIRLIGLGFHSIEKIDEYSQGELFEDDNTRKRQVEESVFRIKSRFPELPMMKASLLGRKNRSSPKDAELRAKEEQKKERDASRDDEINQTPSKPETRSIKPTRSLGKKAAKSTHRSRGGRGKASEAGLGSSPELIGLRPKAQFTIQDNQEVPPGFYGQLKVRKPLLAPIPLNNSEREYLGLRVFQNNLLTLLRDPPGGGLRGKTQIQLGLDEKEFLRSDQRKIIVLSPVEDLLEIEDSSSGPAEQS